MGFEPGACMGHCTPPFVRRIMLQVYGSFSRKAVVAPKSGCLSTSPRQPDFYAKPPPFIEIQELTRRLWMPQHEGCGPAFQAHCVIEADLWYRSHCCHPLEEAATNKVWESFSSCRGAFSFCHLAFSSCHLSCWVYKFTLRRSSQFHVLFF